MKPRLLLLNPPGSATFIRNYFCSQTSKAGFINQPIDLIVQSAFMRETHSIDLLDCILAHLSPDAALDRVAAMAPQAIIALSGLVSWSEDAAFFARLKARLDVPLLAIGDVFLEEPVELLEASPFLDGVLLDFCAPDAREYLAGRDENVERAVVRRGETILDLRRRPRATGSYAIPIPCHELFVDAGYTFPFIRGSRYATVLTDFGCPFRCTFCVMSALGYKTRPLENVLEELDHLHGIQVRELFFIDQTFAASRERAVTLLDEMIRRGYAMSWACFTRVDRVDGPLLDLMARAGCHTIIFGVESAAPEILMAYRKDFSLDQVRRAFALCQERGIRTVGTFLLGLPEDTEASCLETIGFARSLNCDFASFNIAVPRPTTALRRIMGIEKLFDPSRPPSDQAGRFVEIRTRSLSPARLAALQRYALRTFYFRPSYLLHRLRSLQSWRDLFVQGREALAVLGRGWLGSK